MLLSKTVKMKWSPNNKKWYESKGYIFTKWKDEFEVRVEDLSKGSHFDVDIKCDSCGEISNIKWTTYLRYVKEDKKYYCKKCANYLFGKEQRHQTQLINSVSFYDWCYQNLEKSKADEITLRWNYELNEYSPKNISFSSVGINGKGYWFRCLEHFEHKSELKSISTFTSGHDGSIKCNQCNSLAQYMIDEHGIIDITTYWSDKNIISPFEIDHCSRKRFWFKCPDCGYEKLIACCEFIRRGFSCNKCGDGISYPNKIGFNVLHQLNIEFITEYNPKWITPKKYDFYFELNNKQYILEMDGYFHSNYNKMSGQTAEESKAIDDYKDKMAKEHNIEVIRIDCDYQSNNKLEYIKNNILNSSLNDLFDLSKIDWTLCQEYALSNLVIQACKLWNQGTKNINEISEIIKMNGNTVRKYLKHGAKLNWCNYNSKELQKQNHIELVKIIVEKCSKKVYCVELNQIFNSGYDAYRKMKIYHSSINKCCNKKYGYKSAGKHPITGEPLHWMFYEDYLKQQNKQEIISKNIIQKEEVNG